MSLAHANGLDAFEALGLLHGATRGGDWGNMPGEVTGLSVDSRDTKPGHIFAALSGSHVHGAEFVSYALRMGAVAVLTDAEGLAVAQAELGPLSVPVLVHEQPRRALALAAARWFQSQPETMAAVTGTNGKTSVASFLQQIWTQDGKEAVNFGTTGVEGAASAPLSHTTPEPITLHRLLADLNGQAITHAAMEASSHGLSQHRLDGVRLLAGGFTNITRDHLDYHADFEAYFEAKMGLFSRVLPKGAGAVINMNDPSAPRVVAICEERGLDVLTVGRAEDCDLTILASRYDAGGQDLRFAWRGVSQVARLDLIGGFQAENALVAVGLAIATGVRPGRAFEALSHLEGVRGRMQKVAMRDNGAPIFVDYAHTPDALATALKALRPHVLGRLIVVFGAGGDRDPGKRPLMGQAAAAQSDVAIVTDDNPRSEDPALIRQQVRAGCPEATEIGDRAEAILAGVDALQPGDALLIAGKGHETGQIVGDDVLPFDDAEQASVAVAALEGRLA